MKKTLLILLFLFSALITSACPVCDKQQPKILKGITHGGGPGSQWDYVIVCITAVVVVVSLFYSIKWLFKPGEKSPHHIKQLILNAE